MSYFKVLSQNLEEIYGIVPSDAGDIFFPANKLSFTMKDYGFQSNYQPSGSAQEKNWKFALSGYRLTRSSSGNAPSDCWGLPWITGIDGTTSNINNMYSCYSSALFNESFGVSELPFSKKTSSSYVLSNPLSASDTISYDYQTSPFLASQVILDSGIIYVRWDLNTQDSCILTYNGTSTSIKGDGVWLFLQAPGGGGGFGYLGTSGGYISGGGGGSGACALVYLSCKLLHILYGQKDKGGSHSHFKITIGAKGLDPTSASTAGTTDPDCTKNGTSGGDILISRIRYDQTPSGFDEKLFVVHGGAGGKWLDGTNETSQTTYSKPGTGGSYGFFTLTDQIEYHSTATSLDHCLWVAFSHDGLSGGYGRNNGVSGYTDIVGSSTTSWPSYKIPVSGFYLARYRTCVVSGNGTCLFGKGEDTTKYAKSSSSPYNLGGGGGSCCAAIQESTGVRVETIGWHNGMGGRGSWGPNTKYLALSGGEGAVYILKTNLD